MDKVILNSETMHKTHLNILIILQVLKILRVENEK